VIIQQLLAEAGHSSFERQLVSVEGHGAEAGADWRSLRSPEADVGYVRAEHFASPGGELLDPGAATPWGLSQKSCARSSVTACDPLIPRCN
jgi:hypothetical protein